MKRFNVVLKDNLIMGIHPTPTGNRSVKQPDFPVGIPETMTNKPATKICTPVHAIGPVGKILFYLPDRIDKCAIQFFVCIKTKNKWVRSQPDRKVFLINISPEFFLINMCSQISSDLRGAIGGI